MIYFSYHRSICIAKYNFATRETFTDADMRGSNIENSNFRGSNFNGVDFSRLLNKSSHSSFKSYFITNIINSDLRDCTFNKANFSYANLRGTNIQGADFSTAILNQTNFNGAIYDRYTKFPKNFSISKFKMKKIEEK